MVYRMIRRAARRGRYNRRANYNRQQAQQQTPIPPTGANVLKLLIGAGIVVGGIALIDHHDAEVYGPPRTIHITAADHTHLSTVSTIPPTSVAGSPQTQPNTVATITSCTVGAHTVVRVTGTVNNPSNQTRNYMVEVMVKEGAYTAQLVANENVTAGTSATWTAHGTMDGKSSGTPTCSVESVVT